MADRRQRAPSRGGVPLRILITTDAVGGVWDHTRRLAVALAEDHEVTLAIAGPGASDMTPPPGVASVVVPGPLEWMGGGAEHVPKVHDALRDLVAKDRIDLVHANAYGHVLPDADVPTVLTAHSSLHGWWHAVHGATPPPESWEPYAAVVRQALTDARLVIAPTRAMLEEVAWYGRPAGPGLVVHNGLPTPAATSPHPIGTRRRTGPQAAGAGAGVAAETRRPHALSGGRLWDPGKGFHILDEAAAEIPWSVLVTGQDTSPTGARASFRHLHHLGHLERPALEAAYAAAGVYVNPALYEAFGLGALEAAHRGKPLVLPDLPSQRELWDGAALFFPPGDADALAQCVSRLAYDASARRRAGDQARRMAGRYTIQAMVEGHLAAYEEAGAIPCTT